MNTWLRHRTSLVAPFKVFAERRFGHEEVSIEDVQPWRDIESESNFRGWSQYRLGGERPERIGLPGATCGPGDEKCSERCGCKCGWRQRIQSIWPV